VPENSQVKGYTRLGASLPEDGKRAASEMLCIFKNLDDGQVQKKEHYVSQL
jgi:hypothetical protein